ncbi:MAG: hypothetical protein JW847_01605 [Candidatus Omnitrophica bacterium]|nr:hypothetical protein [Candidatus Omnitrophota bacterium]
MPEFARQQRRFQDFGRVGHPRMDTESLSRRPRTGDISDVQAILRPAAAPPLIQGASPVAIQREEADTSRFEDAEERRRFRRENCGRMARWIRAAARLAPGPIRRIIERLYGDRSEEACEAAGEAMEQGHERRDRRIEEIENEAY